MAQRKFTVFLIPDEDGYQVIVPHYPECATWGKTPEEALDNAKEAIEHILEVEAEKESGDTMPHNIHASHVVVGDIVVEVPESLLQSYQLVDTDAGN